MASALRTESEANAAIQRWFAAAVQAVDPINAVAKALERTANGFRIDGHVVDVRGRLFVAAIGKAAATMTVGAEQALGDLIESGVVLTKDGHLGDGLPTRFAAFEAAHPIPDDRGRLATEFLLDRLDELGDSDVVLVLLSGGGSALLEAPVDGVTMQEMAETTGLLLRAGAPIQHLNAVRVPLSKVKGGGLRMRAPQCRFVSLLLSDVLGNNPQVIASGPTVPTEFAGAGALELLRAYRVIEQTPSSVIQALERSEGAMDGALFAEDMVTVIGDNARAVAAFSDAAEADGLTTEVAMIAAEGEARDLAKAFVARLVQSSADLVLGGGEATVTVRGDGLGGRNTEFALSAALELERLGRRDLVVASLATDGQDALTGVAGAIGSIAVLERARAAGVDPAAALEGNDSLAVFRAAGGAIEPGPTGTNVNDIYAGLRLTS